MSSCRDIQLCGPESAAGSRLLKQSAILVSKSIKFKLKDVIVWEVGLQATQFLHVARVLVSDPDGICSLGKNVRLE